MEQSFLRSLTEVFFTLFPSGFFLQVLNVLAAILNSIFGAFGVETNIVGF